LHEHPRFDPLVVATTAPQHPFQVVVMTALALATPASLIQNLLNAIEGALGLSRLRDDP